MLTAHTLKFSYVQITTAVLVLILLGSVEPAAGNPTNSISSTDQTNSSSSPELQLAFQYTNDTSYTRCWGWAPSCVSASDSQPIFALLGDSITAFGFLSDGWGTKLAMAYQGLVNMVNYGVEGATTRRVDEVADKVLQQLGPHKQRVQLATIWFGANDAVTPHAPRWHLPLPQYKENVQRLVSRLQEMGIPNIVLMTPPPVGRRADRKNNFTADYAQAVRNMSQELQLPVVDVYSSIMAVDKWQQVALDKDQLHLSPLGQEVVYNSLVQVLMNSTAVGPQQLLEQLQQQKLQAESQQQQAASEQQQQQAAPQQQQQAAPEQQKPQGIITDTMYGHSAMKVVLCVVLVLLFVAVITEAKRQPHSHPKKELAV